MVKQIPMADLNSSDPLDFFFQQAISLALCEDEEGG